MSARRVLRAGGLWFDGRSYVSAGSPPNLSGRNNITVVAWARPSIITGDLQAIVTKWDWDGRRREWWLGIYQSYPNVGLFDEATGAYLSLRYSTPLKVKTEWFMIAFTFDGLNYVLYLNAEVVRSGAWSGAIRATASDVRVGMQADGSWPFSGIIGEVRIYSRALSEDEVKAIYERGDVIWRGLVLYLDFSEYEGNVAYDKSGFGNHGTIYGARWVVKKALRVLPSVR